MFVEITFTEDELCTDPIRWGIRSSTEGIGSRVDGELNAREIHATRVAPER